MRPPHQSDERGSASVEVVLGLPVFLLLVGLVILGGRTAIATQAVQAAASDAARAASIARTASQAHTAANSTARHSLANQNVACATTTVSVDTSAFHTTVGTPGQVTATVTCALILSDLALPGVGGTKTITATMSSPLDTHRERE